MPYGLFNDRLRGVWVTRANGQLTMITTAVRLWRDLFASLAGNDNDPPPP